MVNKNSENLQKYMEETRSCIICNGNNFESWAKRSYFEAKKCKYCGMISVNPHLTNEGLSLYYKGYLAERLNEKVLLEQRKKTYLIDRDWINNFIDHGKVLDVGCSGGQFLSTFDPQKWERFGVDVEQSDADFAEKNYGISVKVGNFTELDFQENFDLIVIRGVIEHISEPIGFLKKVSELLKPGGFFLITATPAGDSFAFSVYRGKWHLFTPPEHLHFFSVKLLSKKLKELGLSLVSHHYQYEETPYANPNDDFKKMQNDIILFNAGKSEQVQPSPPFPGSMITAVWRKQI